MLNAPHYIVEACADTQRGPRRPPRGNHRHRRHCHYSLAVSDPQTAKRSSLARLCREPCPGTTVIVVGIISLLSIVNLRQDLTGAADGEPATLVVASWRQLRSNLDVPCPARSCER